jgi:hypothetical protein
MRSPVLNFRVRLAAATAGGLLLLVVPVALAQNAPTPITPAPVAPVQGEPIPDPGSPPPAAQPGEKEGLFEAIGRWIDRSNESFRSHLQGAKQRMDALGEDAAEGTRDLGKGAAEVTKGAVEVTKGAVEVTKGAVDTVVKLPATRVIRGNERCGLAPNGAPDCVAAAEALCRKAGFATGKSMDFTSAEECSGRVLLSGRQSEADCKTVTFISRAVCQ